MREAEVGLEVEASPLNFAAAEDERLRRVLTEAEATCRVLLPQLAAMFLTALTSCKNRGRCYKQTPSNGSAFGLPLDLKFTQIIKLNGPLCYHYGLILCLSKEWVSPFIYKYIRSPPLM